MNRVCDEAKCTLCMACVNVCPQNAIDLDADELGYERVKINSEKCIDCGLCQKVCKRREGIMRNVPHTGYAAQAKDKNKLKRSASGGAFQMLAEHILEKGGVCYGCNSYWNESGIHARHLRVDKLKDLPLVLNSKYIPSIIGESYSEALEDLKTGKTVLFSGTPCQIQGLKAFLNKDYEKLLTVDVICHGIPSTKLFNDYIKEEEKKYGIKIVDYGFRDKSVSWGSNFYYRYYKNGDNNYKIRMKHLPKEASSFEIQYLRGNISRENCYTCSLASKDRVSDFTFGDFWEIEVAHPELVTNGNPNLVLRHGISCILANTEKAKKYIDVLEEKMVIYEVDVESIVAHNGNLRVSSEKGKDRERVLQNLRNSGYISITNEYETTVGKKMAVYRVKNLLKRCLPDRVRIMIYNNPKLRKMIFR